MLNFEFVFVPGPSKPRLVAAAYVWSLAAAVSLWRLIDPASCRQRLMIVSVSLLLT